MVKPAQASGTVNSSLVYWGGSNGTGFNCAGLASLAAVQSCELALHNQLLAGDLTNYNGNLIYHNAYFPYDTSPLSCPAAALTDYGPSSPYADVFAVTYYRAVYSAGGFWIPIYYKYCDAPRIDNYFISTGLSCPANSKQTGNTCSCNDTYMPDPTATSCVPEQYTISLSGLGVDVMPNKTLAAYAR